MLGSNCANCFMLRFWHVTSRPNVGFAFLLSLESGAAPSLHLVRESGSAFFSLGLLATSVYVGTDRSSMWADILKRSISRARIIGCRASILTEMPARDG